MPTVKELGPGYYAIDTTGADFDAGIQKRIRDAFKRAAKVPAAQLKMPTQILPWASYELIKDDDGDR